MQKREIEVLNWIEQTGIVSAFLGAAALYSYYVSRRSALDVIYDLDQDDSRSMDQANIGSNSAKELSELGLFSDAERKRFRLIQTLIPIGCAMFALLLKLLFGAASFPQAVIILMLGLSVGYIITKRRLHNAKADYLTTIEFYVPIIMERMVMTAQAGLDVISAVGRIIELEKASGEEIDPVTRLLEKVQQLTENGQTFDRALKSVSGKVECSALKHAFIHLAVAYKEGGELTIPLRELSDSMQLYYQESVEEEIAKMPVKATAPLLCMFVGIMIIFIIPPLLQIMETIGNSIPPS